MEVLIFASGCKQNSPQLVLLNVSTIPELCLPGRGRCVVFLGKHLTLTVPLSTQEYKWVPANCWGKPNKLPGSDLRWISILSRGSRNTPSRFKLQKPGISSGSYGPVASKASLCLPGRGRCVVFLGKHLTLTVPLSTQEYKWVPAN